MPSYSPVFSQGFVYYTSVTPNTDFEVPTGFTAIVRDALWTQTIGGYNAYLFIGMPEAGELITAWAAEAAGALNTLQWTGRIVVPEGGLIRMGFSELGDTPSMYCGGYLLRNNLT